MKAVSRKHGITRRLIIYIVVFSSFVTLLITTLQLFQKYLDGISEVEGQIKQIEQLSLPAVTENLWNLYEKQIQAQLEDLIQLPDVRYLEIRARGEVIASAGTQSSRNAITETLPLTYILEENKIPLGSLVVVATLDDVYQKLIDQAVIILLSNSLKTALVSLFIFLFFQFLVTKHLSKISNHLQNLSSDNLDTKLILERKPTKDELSQVVASVNEMTEKLSLDIIEQKRIEEELFAQKERIEVTLHSIGDAVISTDIEGRIDYLNPIAETLTGWSVEEAKGRLLEEVFRTIDENTRKPTDTPVARCLEEGKIVALANHTILLGRSGNEYAIESSASPISGNHTKVLGVVLIFRDVTAERELSKRISYQATHDTLTGLINRGEFERRLRRVLETTHEKSTENALCFLDLDQFKLVNDTGGHMAGDQLLRELGQLLTKNIRKRDTLARLGGDEFGLLMEHCSIEKAWQVAESILKLINEFSFPWEERSYKIGVSIGLVAVNSESGSLESLLKDADAACYMAKKQGRNRIHLHKDDDEERIKRQGEMQWAVRLPRALTEGRFQLYFQTIVPVDIGNSNPLDHYELLLRMQDEKGNQVQPGVFLPAAERYQLSVKIDYWVISRALKWFQDNPAKLEKLNLCSINLSGLSLSNNAFLPFILRELESSGVPPRKICFEIAETTAIANLSSATTFIQALKQIGCRSALDDFGSGLSSFAYLKNLPVDYLKIDGSFVKNILEDPMSLAMVKSINEIGHVMGKQTIAEFVENDAILERLREIGVDYAQGYSVSRPRPLKELLISENGD